MQTLAARSILALLATSGIAASVSLATPPSFTITSIARSGNTITNPADPFAGTLGPINQINQFPGGQGFFGMCVNSGGSWLIDADTQHSPASTVHEALLRTQPIGGFYTPYVVQGFAGYMSAPTSTTVANTFMAMSLNNAADAALVLAWSPDDTCTGCQSTGVFFNSTKAVFLQGDIVAVAGLAPAATWDPFDSSTCVRLVDSNRLLVVSRVAAPGEAGGHPRIVLVAQLDAMGNVTGKTLIAKEGGTVGGGPATWTTIGAGANAAAMNSAGTVVFSGTTSTGTDGVYSTSASGFIAVAGGPTPVPGTNWGPLTGSSVGINSAGTVAFGGLTAASSTFAEAGDAGDVVDGENHTFGNGPLTLVTGTLSNDQDVDMFRIVVTDPANFSATTVPNPGAGFAGAAFDTVLTLCNEPGNGQRGLTQCDDAAPGVMQSTITGTPRPLTAGRSYYLAISTPKSRCQGTVTYSSAGHNTTQYLYVKRDMWQGPLAGLAVDSSSGLLYWPDTASGGVIKRATTAGVAQSDLSAPSMGSLVCVDSVGGKIYWADRAATSKIRRSNLDGTGVEDLNSNNTFGQIGAYDVTGLAVDPVNGFVYWTRGIEGELNRMTLSGANPTRIIQNFGPNNYYVPATEVPLTFCPEALAVDTSAGTLNKLYFYNAKTERVERCNLDGSGRNAFLVSGVSVGAGSSSLAIDSAGGYIYWAVPGTGGIQRARLDGSGSVQDVAMTSAPAAISLDTAAGMIYWTSPVDRTLRRASLTGGLPAAASDVLTVGPFIGERVPDGVASTAGFDSWARSGVAGGATLPYQIKLTGATFQYPKSLLVAGAQKIAAVGDAVGGVAGSTLSVIGSGSSPVRITDRGDVFWTGQYLAPSMYINRVFDGLLFNQDLLIATEQTVSVSNAGGLSIVYLLSGTRAFDASSDGSYALISANTLTSPFVQPDHALLFQFSYPATSGACCNGSSCSVGSQASCTGVYQGNSTACGPVGNPTTCCPANFNGVNGLSVQDIFDFLNAWFAGAPAADFNHVGGLSVQDIFDFLNAWFAGC